MQNNGNPKNKGFLPLRSFVFDGGSFSNETYAALIEVLDPLSPSSAGHSYGWDLNGTDSFMFKMSIDDDMTTGSSAEVLKANSSYDDILPLDN
jgi:hypothetical protein